MPGRWLRVFGSVPWLLTTATAIQAQSPVSPPTPTSGATQTPAPPAGNPLLGMLIIAGIILIAVGIIWLISRAEDTSPS
ncbi:MAG: hypothetical protein NZ703_03365 [Gemmataceae bacterium]|nr:hypothetical protein [Gemmataceae bacterium]MCS7270103.1 hypothetical protein [Gemmataceae bacterium]MDW8244753.1 hypothetical protein [Thermogemmata sp.]